MNFNIVFDNLAMFLWGSNGVTSGLLLTVELLLTSLLLGFLLALPLTVMRVSKRVWVSGPVWMFTYVFRGTPLLIQLYVIYYGLAEISFVRESWAWTFLRNAHICAWLAFSLNTAAYTCEIFAGSLRSTAPGEVEAAVAYGMSWWGRMRYVLLPGALRRALPAYSNEVIFTLHGTALASAVTLYDLAGVARAVSMRYAAPYEPYIAALILYAVSTFTLFQIFRMAEKKWMRHLTVSHGSQSSKKRASSKSPQPSEKSSLNAFHSHEGNDVRS